ncbi:major facilitator superfamily domain-containing protein 4A-like isoform X2 [Amphiura filiformis]|uniref:major facilitator superfamily domain-containing protein 4A-like isoform X2 n=1 Tax=Amphiura filiformis TaxID=82378 RepID=UPI003B2196DF
MSDNNNPGKAMQSGTIASADPGNSGSEKVGKQGEKNARNEALTTAKSLFLDNLQATITYCSVFWSFGMCVALLGPTLLDLGCQTGSSVAEMSWAFLSQSLSTLIGSMLGGIMVDRISPDPLLLISTVIIAGTIAFIPWCTNLWILIVDMAVMGIFMGIIDTVANVSLLKIYGKLVSPFLQALHFCYGLGAFISPIVAEPFILNEDCSPLINNNSGSSEPLIPIEKRDVAVTAEPTDELPSVDTLEEAREKTHVKYAFWIMSMIQIPIIVLVLALICRRKVFEPLLGLNGSSKQLDRSKYEDLDKDAEDEVVEGQEAGKTLTCCQSTYSKIITVTLLTSLILFMYDGLQSAYGGFIFAYAVKNNAIVLSSTDGAYITSVYWGSFALGRLISIPISTRISPAAMLLCNLLGCFVALTLEVCLRDNYTLIFICSAIFGLSLSSIYPTAIAHAEQYIHMTGFVTSCVVIGAATGEMVFPVMVGRLFFPVKPWYFLIFLNVISIVGILLFISLIIIVACPHTHDEHNAQNAFIFCRTCCITSSQKQNLIANPSNFYTTLHDTGSAYQTVTSSEQIPLDKIPGPMPPKTDHMEYRKDL